MAEQNGFPARGQDVLVRIKVDGVIHRYPLNSVDVDFGIEVATSAHVGDEVERVYMVRRPSRLRIEAEANSDLHDKLVRAAFKATERNATRVPVQIDVTLRTDHGPGGKPSWAFNGCAFGNPTKRVAGVVEKVKDSFELVCSKPTPL